MYRSFCSITAMRSDSALPEKVRINPFKTLHHAMALIADADLVISPDTSVVHMAAAWRNRWWLSIKMCA